MKSKRLAMLTAILGTLISLSGCSRNMVAIRSFEPRATAQPSLVKGNIHLLPIKKEQLIIEVEPGVTNLDSDWAFLKLKPDNNLIKPSEFVTTADITKLLQERTIAALQQAGFMVTTGDNIPGQAEVTIAPSLQAVFVSLPNPASPFAIVRVKVEFRNVKTGSFITVLITGQGQSFLHFTQAQGLERALDEALDNYQINLVQDTKEFQGKL